MCCKLLQQIRTKYLIQGFRQRGASGVQSSHLKFVFSRFMFGTLVAAYIQYCIFKMFLPLCYIWPPCCDILAADLARQSKNQSAITC